MLHNYKLYDYLQAISLLYPYGSHENKQHSISFNITVTQFSIIGLYSTLAHKSRHLGKCQSLKIEKVRKKIFPLCFQKDKALQTS
jgi:hypothetical protein